MLRNKFKYQISSAKAGGLSFCILLFGFWIYSSAQEQFVYDAKGKRNPFIPLITSGGRLLKLEQENSPEGLLLEGIIYDKQARSYALVNGAVVGIGDAVGDYTVLKIEEDRVVFIKDGEPKEIELKKEEP